MVKLTMCRICLVKNVKMYSMENTNLQVLYKILAAMPFHTQDGRPLQVCYICRAILMKCYRLRVNCLRSEAWFTQILAKKGSNDVPLHNIHKLKIHHPVLRLRLKPEFMETTQNTPEAEDEPVVKKRKLIYKESAENIIPRNPAKDNMDSYNSEQWENSCKVSFLSWKDKNEDVKQSQDCSSTKLIETNAGNIKLENEQIKQEYTEEDTELDKLYIEQDINDFDEGIMVLGGKVLTKQEGEAMSEVDNLPVKHDQIDVKKEYDEIEYLSVKQKEMVTVHDIELQYLVKQENSNNSNVNQNEVNFEEDLDEPENFGLEIENVTKPEMSLEISTQNGGKTLENTGVNAMAPVNEEVSHVGDAALNFYDYTREETVICLSNKHQELQKPKGPTYMYPRPRQRQSIAKKKMTISQTMRGDLTEVYVNDNDVPADIKKRMKSVETMRIGTTTASRFKWTSVNYYSCMRETFLLEKTGPILPPENTYEAFRQYWDDDILSHIVTETNCSAAKRSRVFPDFARNWYDTNTHEILVLFTFWITLGVVRMPSTMSCFTESPILNNSVFKKMFTFKRYKALKSALNFYNASTKPPGCNNPLYCVGPILDHLNSRFKNVFIPSQNISVDDCLTLWEGDADPDPRKRKMGIEIRTLGLCDSATGYLWSFFLYHNATTTCNDICPELVIPLLDKGHTIFMNSLLANPEMAKFLKRRKTDCVGIMNANCTSVPSILSLCSLSYGQFVYRHSGHVGILSYREKTERVIAISTYHGKSKVQINSESDTSPHYKLKVLNDYKDNMVGVDYSNQMLDPYLPGHPKDRWSVKLFKRLLYYSILNARILLQKSSASLHGHLLFRLQLIDHILSHHLDHVPLPPSNDASASGSLLSVP